MMILLIVVAFVLGMAIGGRIVRAFYLKEIKRITWIDELEDSERSLHSSGSSIL